MSHMKFRRRMKTGVAMVAYPRVLELTESERRDELNLGLNLLADVTWKLVLALSLLEEHQDLLETPEVLARMKSLSDALSEEVDILLAPLEREGDIFSD